MREGCGTASGWSAGARARRRRPARRLDARGARCGCACPRAAPLVAVRAARTIIQMTGADGAYGQGSRRQHADFSAAPRRQHGAPARRSGRRGSAAGGAQPVGRTPRRHAALERARRRADASSVEGPKSSALLTARTTFGRVPRLPGWPPVRSNPTQSSDRPPTRAPGLSQIVSLG